MITFWRDTALTDKEQRLLAELDRGHREAAERQNISSQVVQAAYMGSGDYFKAIASAICTLGGTHAPIVQAYEVLSVDRYKMDENGGWWWAWDGSSKIPGWGNSFIKGEPDPTWDETDRCLLMWYPEYHQRIQRTTKSLHRNNKKVYPNAACYTAATAIILGIPKELSPWLVLRARLEPWTKLIYDTTRQSPTQELRDN